jgi:hypothetical protein
MAGTPILFRTTVPTIDLVENLSPKYIVTESPQEFRVVQYPATSFSQSYINWNIIPPSPDTIFSRYIRVTLPVQITITGHNTTGVGSNVVNTLFAGFCTYPLHQIISTLTITFNNQAITIKPSQILDKLYHYTFDREIQKSTMSTTPSYPDQTENYHMIATGITSEFADYSSSVDHISRGSFPIYWINNAYLGSTGATGSASFTAEITEPLMINPLIFDQSWWRRAGITQITNLQVNITIDPSALQNRLWRQDIKDNVVYDSLQVIINQPSLSLIYYTLPTYMAIPPSISYPYAAVQNYIYTFNQIDNTQVTTNTVTSNTIQFQSIPTEFTSACQYLLLTRLLICLTSSFLLLISTLHGAIKQVFLALSHKRISISYALRMALSNHGLCFMGALLTLMSVVVLHGIMVQVLHCA